MFYPLYESTGVNVISFDWNGNLELIDLHLNPTIGMQGNLDPFVLYGSKQSIEDRVKTICTSIKTDPLIFNLGHGLMPDIPIDSVQTVIDTIRSL